MVRILSTLVKSQHLDFKEIKVEYKTLKFKAKLYSSKYSLAVIKKKQSS